jgi:hypothetical protein
MHMLLSCLLVIGLAPALGPGLETRPQRVAPTPSTQQPASVAEAARRLEKLHRDQDWPAVERFLQELIRGDRKRAAAVLDLVLNQRDLDTRSHLISDLMLARFVEAVPTLAQLLEDPDLGVRSWSAIALGELGDRSAVGPLEERLKKEPEERKYHFRIALGKLGRPYTQFFIASLRDRDPERRRYAMLGLSQLQDVRAVPYLLKHAVGPELWEGWNAADAIERLTGVETTKWEQERKNPDGSISRSGQRRPLDEFRKEVEAWLAVNRKEVYRPIEPSAEQWQDTPPPPLWCNLVLQLRVGMSPEQVEAVLGTDYHEREGGTVWYYPPDEAGDRLVVFVGPRVGLESWELQRAKK